MTTRTRIAALLVLVSAFLQPGALAADLEGWHPSAVEATALPRYCWRQFLGDKFKGPQFEIPRKTCGVGTNHYCPALVVLNRANRTFDDTRLRRGYLLAAEKKTLYTLRWIKNYPKCAIRPEVERTYQAIEGQLNRLR